MFDHVRNPAAQVTSCRNRDPEENVESPARLVGERDQVVTCASEPRVAENRESGNQLFDGATRIAVRQRTTNE